MKLRKLCAISIIAIAAFAARTEDKPLVLLPLDKKYDTPPSETINIFWNADGEFGKTENYKELPFHKDRKCYALFEDKAYYPIKTSIRVSAGASQLGEFSTLDAKKVTRHAIYQYTMAEDSSGEVWLFNGNFVLLGKEDAEAELKVLVNNREIKSYTQKGMPRIPVLFEEKLGKLRKGDTVAIAVSPKNEATSNNQYKILFGLEVLPEGKTPSPNINFVLPAPDQPIPPMDWSGAPTGSYKWDVSEKNKELAEKKPGLILLGDSITACWRWGNGTCYSKPGTLEGGYTVGAKKIEKFNALGMGLSGDWTNNVLWRLDKYKFDKDSPPKIATLMIGTNNLGNGHSIDQVVAGNKAIVKTLREKTPTTKVLILGITPRGGKDLNEPICLEIAKINAELEKMANNKDIFYLDLTKALTAPDGKLTNRVFYDGLHLTHVGLEIWADTMLPVLEKIWAMN